MLWRKKQKLPTKPSVIQVAVWQRRRRLLQRVLEENPEGQWSWLWRTRIKVLSYLILRHQNAQSIRIDDVLAESESRQVAWGRRPRLNESTAEYSRYAPPRERLIASVRIDSKKQQSRLASLRQVNEQRRASEPPIPPAPIPEASPPAWMTVNFWE